MANQKKFGINGLVLLVSIGLAFEEARKKTMADGKPEWHEASYFMSPLMQAFTGFNKLKDVPNEVKDLDDSERVELYNRIQNDFELPNDELELKIERGLKVGLEAYSFVQIMTGTHPDFPTA